MKNYYKEAVVTCVKGSFPYSKTLSRSFSLSSSQCADRPHASSSLGFSKLFEALK